MYCIIRYRCSFDTVEAAVRQVNEQLQDGGFPTVILEGHVIKVPRYPEVVSRLADALPQLAERILSCQ